VPKRIEYGVLALKALQRMDRKTGARIVGKIEQLAIDPGSLANNIRRLKGEKVLMRLRIGDWRVIYNEELVVLHIIRIAPRGTVYE
jgi:mRNA interferase RelE/StbE